MDLNIPDLGTSGLLGLIVIISIVVGFIKGLARMFIGLIGLVLGSIGAYWGFMKGGPMLNGYFSQPPSWLPAATGLILGLAFIILTRLILGTMLKPVKLVDGKKKNHAALGAIFGVFYGAVIVFFGVSAIRYLGSVAELERLDHAIGDTEIDKKVAVSPFIKAKNFVDSTTPGKLHQKFDFINDPARTQLAKLKILAQEQHAINASAGSNLTVHKVLSNPEVQKLLATTKDIEVTFLKEKQWGQLLVSERLKKAAQIPEAKELLLSAEIEKSLGIAPKPLFPEPDPRKKEAKEKKAAKK